MKAEEEAGRDTPEVIKTKEMWRETLSCRIFLCAYLTKVQRQKRQKFSVLWRVSSYL